MRVCSTPRESLSSTMSCRLQKSSASSAVKASWAARTSCRRPVRRSRCSPIGGSKRQPSATRTRPSAHSTRCWMPSSTSRVRTSCTSSSTMRRPGHLVAEHVHQVRDEGGVGRPGRRVEPREHRRGVGGGLGGGEDHRAPERGAVVVAVAGDPGDGHPGSALLVGPVGEHGRLAVAGGSAGQQHHRAGPQVGVRGRRRVVELGPGEVSEQAGPLHGSVDATGDRHLRARRGERTPQVCHDDETSQPRR